MSNLLDAQLTLAGVGVNVEKDYYPLTMSVIRLYIKPNGAPVDRVLESVRHHLNKTSVKVYKGMNDRIYIEEYKK